MESADPGQPAAGPLGARRRRGARSVAVALLLALAAGGAWWWLQQGGPAAASRYESAEVTRGPLAARVTATGTLSPRVEVQVGSQVSGRIQELLADFNSTVKAGQVIARIDPRIFEAEVAKARANRLAARAAVARAEADLVDARQKQERASAMAARGIGSQAEADTTLAAQQAAEASLASARATLAQTEAVLGQAETNLGYTTIVSPIDGIVISRQVDVGQTVAASLANAHPLHARRGSAQDGSPHARRRGRRRPPRVGHEGGVQCGRLPARALPRHDPRDPLRTRDGAERGHLRRRRRRREPGAAATARHDGRRLLRGGRTGGRAARPQQRLALPAPRRGPRRRREAAGDGCRAACGLGARRRRAYPARARTHRHHRRASHRSRRRTRRGRARADRPARRRRRQPPAAPERPRFGRIL